MKKADMVGDGTLYAEDIDRITEWHPIIRYKFYHSVDFLKPLTEYMQMYVIDKKLDIKYYRDNGDLIELFPE